MGNESILAYVTVVSSNKIRVKLLDSSFYEDLRNYGFDFHVEFGEWVLLVDEEKKYEAFRWLQDHDVCFASGPAGWPPGAVFELYREQGKLSGNFRSISWRGPNDYYVEIK